MTLAGLSLRDLEYAVAVGRLRHFGRAAEQCGVSQSALSEQIRKLEAILGVALFERTRRRVEPTPRGALLLRRAEAVLAEARFLIAAAQHAAEPLSGELRLGVIATLGPYYLPGLLGALRARFPRLQLRLTEARTAELLQQVRRGELDAALLALPADDAELSAQALFFEPFHLVCPAQHVLSQMARVTLADLDRDGMLLLEEGHCLRDQALALCGTAAAGSPARFASSLEMLRNMIAAGEGFSLLPLLATAGRAADGLTHCRKLDDPAAGRTIGLCWRRSDPRGEEFRTLAALLAAEAPAGTRRCHGAAVGGDAV